MDFNDDNPPSFTASSDKIKMSGCSLSSELMKKWGHVSVRDFAGAV